MNVRRIAAILRLIALTGVGCESADAPHNRVPVDNADAATTSQSVTTYAVDAVLLGETDGSGTVSASAWGQFGYDLDGLITTKESRDTCTQAAGSPLAAQVDGPGGTDNAFGAQLMPNFRGYTDIGDPSANATSELRAGAWTLQIQLEGLTSSTNVDGIKLRTFASGSFGQNAPAFDASTDWPVLASSVAGADLTSGAVTYDNDAFVTVDGLVVGRPSAPLLFPIAVKSPANTDAHGAVLSVPLRIHSPIVTFRRSTDNQSLESGVIAGVLDLAELTNSIRVFAHNENVSTCGIAFGGIASILTFAQDILANESNTAGHDCDAISIGIGFTARQVANPTKVVPDLAVTDPCPD